MEVLLGCLLFLGTFLAVAGIDSNDPIFYCSRKQPQTSMDLDQILGIWYVIEVVQHRDDTKHERGVSIVNTCPVLYLERNDQRIRLLWREDAGEVEYKFHITEADQPGFWISSGGQNGSLLNMSYRHFAGTVEVTKAVGSHMVLTFCTPGSELYSVVMARNKSLPSAELRGINRLLDFRGLPKVSVREACKGASAIILPSFILIVALITKSILQN